ncbi:MAG: acyl-CoA synthetase [Gemmatimonadota bacterium]|nr:MAG: acyl-CoA synthetase [Gemmatimonadota bacterium]
MPITIIERASTHPSREALVDSAGSHTYNDLLEASASVATGLLDNSQDLREARVAFLVPADFSYAATQWGIWRAGGIAVPMALSHPSAELEHVLDDAEPTVVVAHPEYESRVRGPAQARGIRVALTSELSERGVGSGEWNELPQLDPDRRAMMLYTSGTTGKPKGVVTTHAQIEAQVKSLIEAWEWVAGDRILLVLPLHHVHGIVNVLTCALWSGACCDMLPRFEARETWRALKDRQLTLFMAVPTIYRRLIAAWEEASTEEQASWSAACGKLRLMVSGSAALPVGVLQRWREVSGHVLLERYGMTEIGMGLSNPLHGERVAGSVGIPLPSVAVRLVDEAMADVPPGSPGEILISGPSVFLEYWRRSEETAAAFHDEWFKTGDVAVIEQGRYRIMGRRSVDIIKSGGYKVSALEIEEILRTHPAIRECAVVGVPDSEWGERVCVAAEVVDAADLTLQPLRQWARDLLAPYKIPKELRVVDALPRNAMGKVTKPRVVQLFVDGSETS